MTLYMASHNVTVPVVSALQPAAAQHHRAHTTPMLGFTAALDNIMLDLG